MAGSSSLERRERGEPGDLGALRRRIALALAIMFAIVMAAAGPFIDWPFGRDGWASRLILLTFVLPPVMVLLARSVISAASEMELGRAELRDLYERARLDSLIDPLTGLGNHRAFQEEFARQVEDARRSAMPLSLVLIDLDDLKRVNDEHGHAGGDSLLAAMGRLLSSDARRSDRAFRIGGDEFAVLLPRTDAENASLTARRLLGAALEGAPAGEHSHPFSFSAGVSAFPDPSSSGARLMRHADAALYWCKRHGRTDVQVYDADRHGQAGDERNSLELAAAVVAVADKEMLTAVYQPIFSLATGLVIGHEALVRPAPGSGFLDAESLFAAAEATGRTVELDTACIRVVAAAAGAVPEDQYLAVNLSPRTLETDEFSAGQLAAVFRDNAIPPSRLVLELTEREAVEDIERLRQNLEACRRVGMRIAADDVGAGNAGLRLLSQITFDLVKIDLSLVQSGVLRESSMAVMRALRELADRSSATIVAEGIETAHQLEVVRDLGLAAGQGYLLGRPARMRTSTGVDIDAIIALDRARRREVLGTLDVDAVA
ncbi:MAG TPA: EAL domain-containing protein [Candidatus Limnocylindrales bacterium]|nr:EAL domain-containing protein [Candidatus Limnocylindrales bacterium]